MNMTAQFGDRHEIAQDRGELLRQAKVARDFGSPFVAAVLEAGHRQLTHAPRTAALFATWPDDPSAAALAMRFNGALHALARRGSPPLLNSLYLRQHDDFDGAIAGALAAEDAFIFDWMQGPPQTNEVGRAAAIGAALMVAHREIGLPFELLEIGSSCGLNLNLARYGYDLGGLVAGVPDSPVQVAPEWRGEPPVYAPIDVFAARGVDLNPLNAADEATRERLLSFVWADQPKRARRLEQALVMAQRVPPRVERGNAVTWLADRLAEPQPESRCRVVMHSMVVQYLSAADRATIVGSIERAGERATAARPLARIEFEWTPTRSEVQLNLTCWPSGEKRQLARCHAYGNWIEWLG